ncbi:MAG: UDP-N-acetylglucosamine 4,6-dehydratase (inverting) [Candidatus Aenigmarchaeota archaeon]|nr:UDP-N-acetylglucosamine 4,6-dehydratase (inverting) [Candidatus Aenigmarchaeota archaeon]
MSTIKNKTILITGGTGSFGKKCTEILLNEYNPTKLMIFSRDELKQFEMQKKFSVEKYPNIRYFLGDVRDKERLYRAFEEVDIVIHAAALKQVPAAEYNPFEFVKTNIMGAQNIINAAIDKNVEKVIALSTDKAVAPINLYGATKLVSDKIFIAGNSYTGMKKTRFSVARYGNVIGSRGSVIPHFLKEKEKGIIPITDKRMTRFWITKEQAVRFTLNCLEIMDGRELFVPKIPSMKLIDLAKSIAPDAEHKIIGVRPGEKLHEVMIINDISYDIFESKDHYVIFPKEYTKKETKHKYKKHIDEFIYSSDNNTQWLDIEDIRKIIEYEKKDFD